jgi:hypothetical protein
MERMQDRPPMIDFEYRPVEDRSKESETGLVVYKDVAFVKIKPAGSKDCFESVADDWIKRQEENAKKGQISQAYLAYFKESYAAFKQGEVLDRPGTHVKNWGTATPAQLKMLLNAGVYTVEDLAAANEDLLKRIGMGARALQQYAINFLESAKDSGATSSKIVSLENKLADAEKRIDELKRALEKHNQSKKSQIN